MSLDSGRAHFLPKPTIVQIAVVRQRVGPSSRWMTNRPGHAAAGDQAMSVITGHMRWARDEALPQGLDFVRCRVGAPLLRSSGVRLWSECRHDLVLPLELQRR